MCLKYKEHHQIMTLNITDVNRIAWSLADIAAATGLSQNFLRYEVRRGNLRTRKFGRRVLVTDEDLRKYIETGSNGAKTGFPGARI